LTKNFVADNADVRVLYYFSQIHFSTFLRHH